MHKYGHQHFDKDHVTIITKQEDGREETDLEQSLPINIGYKTDVKGFPTQLLVLP